MTGRHLPPLEQLAVDIAELLDRVTTEAVEDAHGNPIRRHTVRSPGLLKLAAGPEVLAGGRGSDDGEAGMFGGFGSRAPARVDLLALPRMVVAAALEVLERHAPDVRAPHTAAAALHLLADLAVSTLDAQARRDACSAVASLADTARIGLGFLEPPLQVPLRCLWCSELLVAPATDGVRYLLCRNRSCRCDVPDHCDPEGRARGHRWDERDVGMLIAENARQQQVAA